MINNTAAQKIIKRYKNRKLYDTSTSCYITLHDVGNMVKEGQDVLVIDSLTGKDMTQVILAQVLLGEEKKVAKLPRALFQDIMQSGSEVLSDFYKKRVASNRDIRLFSGWASEVFEVWQKRMDERVQQSMKAIHRASQAAAEIKNLRQTILQLDERVRELEAAQKKSATFDGNDTNNG